MTEVIVPTTQPVQVSTGEPPIATTSDNGLNANTSSLPISPVKVMINGDTPSSSTSTLPAATIAGEPSTAPATVAITSPSTASLATNSSTRTRGSSITSTSTVETSGSVSSKRQAEFEKYFADTLKETVQGEIPDGYLEVVATQSADLQAKLLIHGRLYLTRYHLCFRANILGFKTVKIHSLDRVVSVEKGTTAKWIQNAIYVVADEPDTVDVDGGEGPLRQDNYGSLGDREAMFDDVVRCWKAVAPERYDAFVEKERLAGGALSANANDVDEAEEEGYDGDGDPSPGEVVKHTECSGEHYDELAIDTKVSIKPEQLYQLLYHNREFIMEFYEKDKKLTDVVISDWHETEGKRARDLTYVMHMNNTIGPSKSDCIGSETIVLDDAEKAYEILSETQTPDVPTGKNFKIHTRTCLTHTDLKGRPATRVYCTTQCDWSASSMLKGTITSAVIKGQKEYHQELVRKIRQWIKDHPEEFGKSNDPAQHVLEAEEEAVLDSDIPAGSTTAPAVDDKKLFDNAMNSQENFILLGVTALLVFLLTLWFARSWYRTEHLVAAMEVRD